MSDFLQEMAELSAKRIPAIGGATDKPLHPLTSNRFDVIAEIKDHSPSEGALTGDNADRAERAIQYASAGAAAISVLTEPSRFGGSLEHLSEVADAVAGYAVPVMRKDFLVDALQVTEARAAGASGVLLIAAILDDEALASAIDTALELGMFVLLESFSEADLQRTANLIRDARYAVAARKGQLLVGVNTRNLRTLAVDAGQLARFASQLPSEATCVAESGLQAANDAARVATLGYSMALVGTALMREKEPARLIGEMLQAGREAMA